MVEDVVDVVVEILLAISDSIVGRRETVAVCILLSINVGMVVVVSSSTLVLMIDEMVELKVCSKF